MEGNQVEQDNYFDIDDSLEASNTELRKKDKQASVGRITPLAAISVLTLVGIV
jgi:hypothetical protein